MCSATSGLLLLHAEHEEDGLASHKVARNAQSPGWTGEDASTADGLSTDSVMISVATMAKAQPTLGRMA